MVPWSGVGSPLLRSQGGRKGPAHVPALTPVQAGLWVWTPHPCPWALAAIATVQSSPATPQPSLPLTPAQDSSDSSPVVGESGSAAAWGFCGDVESSAPGSGCPAAVAVGCDLFLRRWCLRQEAEGDRACREGPHSCRASRYLAGAEGRCGRRLAGTAGSGGHKEKAQKCRSHPTSGRSPTRPAGERIPSLCESSAALLLFMGRVSTANDSPAPAVPPPGSR